MRQGLAQVTFPQVFDKVGDIVFHVLAADATAHTQLVEPRLLVQHLLLQFLPLQHHRLVHGDGSFVPFFLTRARAMGGSYYLVFFIFFFYRGCGGKVFFFAFFGGFFMVFPFGRGRILRHDWLDGVFAGTTALGAVGTVQGQALQAVVDSRRQQSKGEPQARVVEIHLGILACHARSQSAEQPSQLAMLERG